MENYTGFFEPDQARGMLHKYVMQISEITTLKPDDYSIDQAMNDLNGIVRRRNKPMEKIGEIQDFDVFLTDHGPNNRDRKNALVVQKNPSAKPKVVAFLNYRGLLSNGIEGIQGKLLGVRPKFQGKNIAVELFKVLADHFGAMFSDERQTPAGNAVWKNLIKQNAGQVIHFNLRSGIGKHISSFPDTDDRNTLLVFLPHGASTGDLNINDQNLLDSGM